MNKLLKAFEDSSAFTEENANFLEELYANFLKDPQSVDISWRERFASLQAPSLEDPVHHAEKRQAATDISTDRLEQALRKQAGVNRLINRYRSRGHQAANNNPLKLNPPVVVTDLLPSSHGLGADDMSKLFYVDILCNSEKETLGQIISRLHDTYCRNIGAEYTHLIDTDIKEWIQDRLESTRARASFSHDQKIWALKLLTAAEGIEKYLHRKYVGQKRFSLEGGESLIPLLDELIQRSGEQGVREAVLGMAHRGRLNVLVNILGKRPALLFQEFEETATSEPVPGGSGDVKYHLGFSSDVATPGGPMHLALAFNPSHLEAVNPVVEGSVRARQDRYDEEGEDAVMAILIHGDAAFAGQGVVMETLNMAETRAYTTGGTIHIVVNNQIGFTTSNPFDARSTLNCTDVAYMVQAPVFHVNGDDPEAVLYVTRLAVDYRMKFKRDVVIDLICLRRHGHNEVDEPAVTQPLMYQFIRKHPGVRTLYGERLIAEGIMRADEIQALDEEYQSRLDKGEIIGRPPLDVPNYNKVRWDRFIGNDWTVPCDTSVAPDRLAEIANQLLTIPDGFELHPRTAAIIDGRKRMASGLLPLDWGFAENMAYASLLTEGYTIRFTGQDVGRGTFFHRHATLYDQNTGDSFTPLQHLSDRQGRLHLYDSLLSEEGVVGFEYGYSSTEPDTLTIWEAQFGDFANNAQVMIDQFISSGETKWGRLSGLVMLLPHGYEGQGPEHSSGRLERYLQLCADMNIQVCVPSTPAQIFHLLRRQLLRNFRKPLIVFTPKSLLRHKLAVSSLDELSPLGGFQPILAEIDTLDPKQVTRVVMCAGKVYYDLLETRRREKVSNVAIIRIEQLYPFPLDIFTKELAIYPNLTDLIWCQEEPANQGAWYQIKHRFFGLLGDNVNLGYAGRTFSPSPAVGRYSRHLAQQKQLVEDALYASPSISR